MSRVGRTDALDCVSGIAAFLTLIRHCCLTETVSCDVFFRQRKTNANVAALPTYFAPYLHCDSRLGHRAIVQEGQP
jgi:hypothetical protein